MSPSADARAAQGALASNIVRFVRILRGAGLSVGPAQTVGAVRAVEAVGLRHRADFYWALHAVLVASEEEHGLFDHAFELFWRGAGGSSESLGELLPDFELPRTAREARAAERRLREAAAGRRPPSARLPHEVTGVDLRFAYSAQERLRTKDFEQMTAHEIAAAHAAVARLRLDVDEIRMRRWQPGSSGRIDMRSTLRATLRSGHGAIPLRWRKRMHRAPALVALCDISGSMERYARVLLHFLHAVAAQRTTRVAAFVFGTRLTNVTRFLEHTDPDDALAGMGRGVEDWSGGTRIGAALLEFNRLWSRRLLGHGAVVLLITDGLDREGGSGIRREARRLRLSCRRLVWLNPLLRYEGFEPKAAGIQALLPEVDELRPVHDLQSLEQLVDALSGRGPTGGGSATRLL